MNRMNPLHLPQKPHALAAEEPGRTDEGLGKRLRSVGDALVWVFRGLQNFMIEL